tara:strand:- start:125 stop:295 length:171 start_codon:yes stop_codon:yes gene_type:complete
LINPKVSTIAQITPVFRSIIESILDKIESFEIKITTSDVIEIKPQRASEYLASSIN